jgi:hypothetical protein
MVKYNLWIVLFWMCMIVNIPLEQFGVHSVKDGLSHPFFSPNEIRSPDRPARSESLYRLSYPGPKYKDIEWNL